MTATLLDRRLGLVLQGGVRLSALLLGAGLLLTLVDRSPDTRHWLLHSGLLVLMATPILRVVVSVVEYLHLRDWFFFATSFAVLLVLAATVISALAIR